MQELAYIFLHFLDSPLERDSSRAIIKVNGGLGSKELSEIELSARLIKSVRSIRVGRRKWRLGRERRALPITREVGKESWGMTELVS